MEITLRYVDGSWVCSFRVGTTLTEKVFPSWGGCSAFIEKWVKDNTGK